VRYPSFTTPAAPFDIPTCVSSCCRFPLKKRAPAASPGPVVSNSRARVGQHLDNFHRVRVWVVHHSANDRRPRAGPFSLLKAASFGLGRCVSPRTGGNDVAVYLMHWTGSMPGRPHTSIVISTTGKIAAYGSRNSTSGSSSGLAKDQTSIDMEDLRRNAR
jgi:hypothetical protein